MDNLHRILEAAIGSPCKYSGTGEYNFCCPFCIKRIGRADTKYHLYINPNAFKHDIRGWFYCHRCSITGPITRIVKGLANPTYKVSDFAKIMAKFKSGNPLTSKKKVELPEDYVKMVKDTDGYKYIRNRGLTDSLIAYYKLGIGTQSLRDMSQAERARFAGTGRIVFPDYDSEGDVCYWVARTYVNHKVKYKNPPFSNAGDQVYNLARASEFQDVLITEGVMSAIAAGKNAVATYGKDVTRTQISMLVAVSFSTYYVALDGDALEKTPQSKQPPPAYRLADALSRKGCNVRLVKLPYEHDPASVPNFQEYVKAAETWTLKTSTQMRMTGRANSVGLLGLT